MLSKTSIGSLDNTVNIFQKEVESLNEGDALVVNLNERYQPINRYVVSVKDLFNDLYGSLDTERHIFKNALLNDAKSIILFQYHSAEDAPHPTLRDYDVTKALKAICNLIGVRLLDHIIVGRNKNYYSFDLKSALFWNEE